MALPANRTPAFEFVRNDVHAPSLSRSHRFRGVVGDDRGAIRRTIRERDAGQRERYGRFAVDGAMRGSSHGVSS